MKILFTYNPVEEVLNKAKSKFIVASFEHELKTEELLFKIKKENPNAIIITLNQKFSADIIKELPSSVKVISTISVGFNHIDLNAAKEKNIMATNTPDVVTDCTADTAMMLMLGASRRGREAMARMENGWGDKNNSEELISLKLTGKTLGIFGMGRIGRAVAKRAKAFDMKILYHNRTRLSKELEDGAKYFQNFHEMLPHCQILSLNAPATSETKNIMGKKEFSLMPKNSIFVNTARGSLVDEDSLIESLNNGHLFGAGLDVYQSEPNFNQNLLRTKNIFLVPHIGTATVETRLEMGLRALENAFMALEGKKPRDLLN